MSIPEKGCAPWGSAALQLEEGRTVIQGLAGWEVRAGTILDAWEGMKADTDT